MLHTIDTQRYTLVVIFWRVKNWSWFVLTLHIKEGIKASDVGEYGQHSSQPIKTAVNYAPYQRHFFPHHLWTLRNAALGLQQLVEMKVRDGVF